MGLKKVASLVLSLTLLLTFLSGCGCGAPTMTGVKVKVNKIVFNPFGKEWKSIRAIDFVGNES